MNSIKIPSNTQQPLRHSNYSIFKRVANLTLVIVAVAICVNLWLLNTDQSRVWQQQQSSQLGRSLTQYASLVIAPYMNASEDDQDTEKLRSQMTGQLDLISQDPHVLGVTIYNNVGQVIESNEQNASVLASYILNENPPLVFVEEIRDQGKILGYLRLMLDEKQVMRYHDDYQAKLYEELLVLMMLAGLVGILVARAYYKLKFRGYTKSTR